jgi:hypothetical protein
MLSSYLGSNPAWGQEERIQNQSRYPIRSAISSLVCLELGKKYQAREKIMTVSGKEIVSAGVVRL